MQANPKTSQAIVGVHPDSIEVTCPVVVHRDPVEALRAGRRRWRQMVVRLARVPGGSAPAARAWVITKRDQ
jgi:hypothetical protein